MGNAVNVHILDVDNAAAAQSAPGFGDPPLLNEPIQQNMEMGDTALVKFQDGDVLDGTAVPSEQVNAELTEDISQIPDWIALDLGGV